ncbi:hypothetical protein Baya_3048 [Bagarius yarrelli]|uniref:Bromo domain-containing protein n=1 Tax=Bagarius yarrelli TaxID=175774 RepID=A0A556TUA4_BAGYA|nr:hypothetical protein Baya_3048 [Bagarius yarrelli]
MKVHLELDDKTDTAPSSHMPDYTIQGQKDIAGLEENEKNLVFVDHLCRSTLFDQAGSNYFGNDCLQISEILCNGSVTEAQSAISHCELDMLENSEDSCSIPENSDHNDSFTPEIQQAHRIFQSFLLEKHKAVTAPFWVPVGDQDRNDMCFQKIEHKFNKREYESITDFVADFRQMLENCYRYHGIDHWISKQAQKLEIMLEQKLTLLSRTLREKTALVVTSRGRFGTEDEKAPVGTSSRRRTVPRNLAAISVCGSESIMVQALRLEEQQRAREEKRQRDLEKREAGEVSAKEVEEWEHSLLSLAEPWPISTMWELPAIGHFLCLAQTALNLPEIVFFELERCLLMPRCSSFLAKIMTSLLCPPHKRITLHRRPALPYRRWEAELRKKVLGWYQSIGRAKDQEACAEHLGLCHQFFWTLGESSPLEEKPFHLLPFNQRVWLLKGLCDNVYETQKDIQDAVLGQPIHECRESILGYDSQENTYIHFPHFCGADLRIYCQSPCLPLEFPLPSFTVKKLEPEMVDRAEKNLSTSPEVKAGKWEFCLRLRDDGSEESEVDYKGPDGFQFHYENLSSLELIKDKSMELKQSLEDKKDTDYELSPKVGIKCHMGKFPAKTLSTNAIESFLPSEIGATVKKESVCQDGHPCPKCSMDSLTDPEPHSCLCFTAISDRTAVVIFQPPSVLRAGELQSKKKRQKKKKETFLGIKDRTGKLGLKRFRKARRANSTMSKVAVDLKKKDKRKRQKLGKKIVQKNIQGKNKAHPPQLPTFKLVCRSLDELRDLISKTEDELDELESTKKRCERWCIKREAVKELHITLIRLLNELLPWEPKLLKAFYKNRARLKKESDDFKKHPEYENFVREELVAFDLDGDAYKEGSSSMENSKELKDEDKNERKLEGLGTTDSENHFGNHSSADSVSRPEINISLSESGPLTRSSKRQQTGGLDEDISVSKKGKMVTDDFGTPEPQTKVTSENQSMAGANVSSTGTISAVTAPLGGFQRRCNPIQALLAKSVGNKVTLISHPQLAVVDRTLQCPKKTFSAALTTTNPMAVCQPLPQPTPVSMQTHTSTTSSVQGPLQILCKAPEGLNLVRNGTPVKLSVQPVIHQKTEEKAMQQVILLPTNLLIQKTEEKTTPQPCSITAVTTSKPAALLSSTPGFTQPNRIPVLQASPLKNISTAITSFPVLPSLQKSTSCGVSPARKRNADPSSSHKQSTTSTTTTTDPNKCDLNQELKTVCIRDSESILVTTRGGNTGVVKVQTSESGASVLPPNPIFTLPSIFQAYLLPKATTVTTCTTQTSTSSKFLPDFSPQTEKGISLNPAPQSPLKCSNPVKPSPLMEKLSCAVPFNNDLPTPIGSVSDNEAISSQILIGINSLVSAKSQTNSSLSSSGWAVQTASSENLSRLTHNKSQESTNNPALPSLQKVFFVTSTTNVSTPASNVITSAPSVFAASRGKFMGPSDSACSTVTVAKELVTSESNNIVKTTSLNVMKLKPNPAQAIASTGTLTEAQGVNVTGLAPRTLNRTAVPSTKTASAPKFSPLIVSSGQIFVLNNNPAANSCSSLNSPVKETGSSDGKCVKFSTCDIRHMPSSELLSAVQQKSVFQSLSTAISVSEILNNRSELVVNSSVPNIVSTSIPRSVMQDKPVESTSVSTASTTVNLPFISSMARICQPMTLNTTTAKPLLDNACTTTKSVMASTIRPPINAFTGTTTIQEKVVINTTYPLAPGTQLLINNTRFVVPAQGLAPGSHVLFISSPSVHPTGQLGPNPPNPVPRMGGTLTTSPAISVVNGLGMVALDKMPQDTSVRQPTPTKTNQPVSLNVLTAVRPSQGSINLSSLAQPSPLGTAQSFGQQTMNHIVGLPSFSLPEVKKFSAASSCIVTSCPQKNITVSAQSQITLPSTTIPDILQTEPNNAAPKVLTVVKPGISLSSSVISMPPTQTLPLATVPPVGGTISSCQTTCVATVSPSINTLLMATCQPVSPVQPENIRMTVTNNPAQVSGVKTIHTPSKLLLSPDGAVLNVLSCPSLQTLPVMTDKSTMGITTFNAPILHILDSQKKVTSNNSESFNPVQNKNN